MIPQQLIHSDHLLQLRLQRMPIRLEHLKRHIRQDLLHERQHPRAEETHAQAPARELGVLGDGAAPGRSHLLRPHAAEPLLDVFEVQEEAEEELVAEDRLS